MSAQFEEHGVRFQYPENWNLEEEETDTGWTVHLQSPNTAFLLLSVDEEMPSTEDVLETALEAMKSEYPDVEAENRIETVAGMPAVGHDIHFTSLDLTNTCCTRSFYTGDATVLLLWQAADLDLEESEPVLHAICASLEVEE